MDSINKVNTDRLWQIISKGVTQYNTEVDESIQIDDVFIVGSVASGDFEPFRSDLDLAILVSGGSQSGVVGGLDVLLREEYHHALNQCMSEATGVDIGVYTEPSYIEDSTVYSCGSDSVTTI